LLFPKSVASGAALVTVQSAYMLWIGVLLGEIRRATGSWPMAWLGHFGYNIAVLHFLAEAVCSPT
jgi:hypothetical protein